LHKDTSFVAPLKNKSNMPVFVIAHLPTATNPKVFGQYRLVFELRCSENRKQ
jgi:hypothetical protein